ncbi:FecR domain-containing protein [Chitinophaga sp. 212800010-3]|uniref:FecR family protein n=1 Tax=unclassified Chitinophaga TaxID=2619133 RepID=UPI002DEFB1E6|nr:FecR family protein [Chitinophaga sp. 212800010-3]
MEELERYLLQKFLDGFCTNEELRRVQVLLNTREGHQLLDTLISQREQQAWDNPPKPDPAMQEIIQNKQAEMMARISAEPHRGRPFQDKARAIIQLRKPLRYAAIWTGLLLVAGFAGWQIKKNYHAGMAAVHYVEKSNRQGIPVCYTLPDSTLVYLAAGSTLKYPEAYPQNGRDVQLLGEAFFDVKPDKDHPFSIHSGNIETRVLGTSFRITAFAGQQQEVAVATGRVSVSAIHQEETTTLAELTPGMKVTYDPQSGKTLKGKVDIYKLEQWKSGELTIDEQPMTAVALQLERRYGVQLVFADPETANSRVSGTFSATEPVSGVLDMLGFVGKFRHEKGNGKIINIYKTK